jgi:hypothetical protein
MDENYYSICYNDLQFPLKEPHEKMLFLHEVRLFFRLLRKKRKS